MSHLLASVQQDICTMKSASNLTAEAMRSRQNTCGVICFSENNKITIPNTQEPMKKAYLD